MDVLLVVDMQEASVSENNWHDVAGVLARINALAARVRDRGGCVVFVQHDGSAEEGLVPFTPGWEVARALEQDPRDRFLRKTLNDPFHGTTLNELLRELKSSRLLISGWATDFCVDAAVRSAVARGYDVVVVSDGHTLDDRPHLHASQVITHHNWVWERLITNASVRVATAAEL